MAHDALIAGIATRYYRREHSYFSSICIATSFIFYLR
jgi:hypothetical protein